MAAWAGDTTKYASYRDALLLENGAWLGLLNSEPINAGAGAVSWPIPTAVTLTTATDGTLLTNGALQTFVAGTAFDYIHPIKLKSYQKAGFLADRRNLLGQVTAATNAARAAVEALFVVVIVAGTPGSTTTLPAGQKDFSSDGSVAKQYLAMNKLDAALGYIEANCGGKPGQPFILCSLAGFQNLKTLKNNSTFAGRFELNGSRWTVDGYPIYTTNYTTNFGGASKETLYVIHPDALGLVWEPLESPSNFELVAVGDGMWGMELHSYGFYKLLQVSHIAAVDSTTS